MKASLPSRRPSGLRKTTITLNSLAHRTTWLRSDFPVFSSLLKGQEPTRNPRRPPMNRPQMEVYERKKTREGLPPFFVFVEASKTSHSSRRKRPPAQALSPVTQGGPRLLHQGLPTFRATLSRKLTAPFCRLPLPTLFYRLEAAHLGDLMRL